MFFIFVFLITQITFSNHSFYNSLSTCIFETKQNCSLHEQKIIDTYLKNKHYFSQAAINTNFPKNLPLWSLSDLVNYSLYSSRFESHNKMQKKLHYTLSLLPLESKENYLTTIFANNILTFNQINSNIPPHTLYLQQKYYNRNPIINTLIFFKIKLHSKLSDPISKNIIVQKFIQETDNHYCKNILIKHLPRAKKSLNLQLEKIFFKIIPILNSNINFYSKQLTYTPSLHYLSIILYDHNIMHSYSCLQKLNFLDKEYSQKLKLNKHAYFVSMLLRNNI